MILILTTAPGIEDLVISELREKVGEGLRGTDTVNPGMVMAIMSDDVDLGVVRGMGTVENAVLILGVGSVGRDINTVRECMGKLNLEGLLTYYTANTTLGLEVDRSGEHDFKSPEAASVIGEFLSNYILGRTGLRPVFNLDNPDLEVRVIIVNDRCMVGINLTRRSLRDRPYRRYSHPASINPIIANAMIRILNPKPHTRICDITCGSGTIVIEGALNYGGSTYLCADIDRGHVLGALENIKAAGVYDKVDLLVMDATRPALRERACDYAIFNPPFGIRVEPIQGIKEFYHGLLTSLSELIRDSAVFITIRKSLVRSLARELGFDIVSERVVEQGGIYSSIFKLRVTH
ncbi:methyltransferase [Vulcanisaeta thermophila]|uniref:methyltransferase n=1 Tax=Vulcanisaeta thermophila TaxID=867917 RepID=UPI000853E8B9|nr:methyltransferase [Vulcanisaeta thermophila]